MTFDQSHDTPLGHAQQYCVKYYADLIWQGGVMARIRILDMCAQ